MEKIRCSITVMAHPSRADEAKELHKKLMQYPFTQCTITWDNDNTEWHTGRRALLNHDDSDYHVVIQDDAIINEYFYTNLIKALEAAPFRTLISLYTGTVRPYKSRVATAVKNAYACSWLRGTGLFWGVGIAIPTDHIVPMLEFADSETDPYDTRIGMFYFRNIMPVLYTNPSLVDHNDYLGSLVGNGYEPEPRVAHNFIDRDIKWNKNIIDI